MANTRPARPLFWVIALLLTAGVCAGLAELAARIAKVQTFRVREAEYIGWAKRDSVLGWRNNPGVFRADERPHEPMTFLADGSRSTGTPPGAGGDPVVIVGCSFAEGYGVRDDQTFAWLLQRRFPGRPILNFGTPGYGTYQSWLLLNELMRQRRIHPAAVIYGFIPMHAERNVLTFAMLDAFRAFGGLRFSPPHVEIEPGLPGALKEYPPFVVSNWPLEEHSAFITAIHRAELRARLRNRESGEERATALLVSKLKSLAESVQAPFLVATLWDDGPPGAAAYRRMAAAMRGAGVDEIDATYRGTETTPERLRVGGYGHPGPAVHEWWADRIGGWLGGVFHETGKSIDVVHHTPVQ